MSNFNVTVDKETNQIIYNREFAVTPFSFNVFPMDRERFSIIILAPEVTSTLQNLFQYILNSYIDENIINCLSNNSLYKVEEQFQNYNESEEILKNKLAIIDLSPTNIFKSLHPSIIHHEYFETNPKWLTNLIIKNILLPNCYTQTSSNLNWKKNFSHTIWLINSIDNLPPILTSISHLTFLISDKIIHDFFEKRLKINKFKIHTDNPIYVVSSTLTQDIKIMTMPKNRFSNEE
jgi:hypothetical protein